ncbi:Fe2+-dicitrate sensor, membrane component [Nitrospira japonica]|uniref:Fe2+-dicitrate sensor, membrane component n=1 Tax=Nitrospira japonica TaxID=1325564 RepID=A0A1W1I7P1_9BACT|nr:FecR domain-containing protein [Nitrospira japonica]SLM48879.1 Fe2+-dicitrate sensor, membrane component [Nitrospira japonica]
MSEPQEPQLKNLGTPDERLSRIARDWVIRLASGHMSEAELRRFKQWLAEHPSHQRVFDDERVFWQQLEPLKTVIPANHKTEQLSISRKQRLRPHWRVVITGAVAAGLAGLLFYQDIRLFLSADHRTATGQQQIVQLPDGGLAHLNTDTAIAVSYTEHERRIEILKGEAFFEVVPNRQAPFRVLTQGGITQAVGTAFAVHAQDRQATVTVTEGTVDVATKVTGKDQPASVTVHKDQETLYRVGEAPRAAMAIDGRSALSWIRGGIVIDKKPFAEAMAELNRYRPGRIVVLADPARTKLVSGRFILQGLDDAVTALAKTQGLTVVRLTPYLVLIL